VSGKLIIEELKVTVVRIEALETQHLITAFLLWNQLSLFQTTIK